MAIIHIDYTNGDDTTGDGSSGTPYKTLTKAFAVLTTSDSIKIANTSAQQETNIAFPALTFTVDIPLIIEGWDNGGSIVIDNPVADITGVGEIDNSGTTSALFSNAISHVKFYRIKFSDFATNFWSTTKSNVSFVECEFYNCATMGTLTTGTFLNCAFYGAATTTEHTLGTSTAVINCFFNRTRFGAVGASCTIINNIFYSITGYAIQIGSSGDGTRIINNTFIGLNLNSATLNRGILYNNAASEDIIIIGNHFQNFSGSGGYGMEATATIPTTRGTILMLGGNSFYNVNTAYESGFTAATVVDITATDIVESSDPLIDVSNLEFGKKTTATSYQSNPSFTGYPETNTVQFLTTGAVADEAGTGGGGDTESSYAGV